MNAVKKKHYFNLCVEKEILNKDKNGNIGVDGRFRKFFVSYLDRAIEKFPNITGDVLGNITDKEFVSILALIISWYAMIESSEELAGITAMTNAVFKRLKENERVIIHR